MHRRSHEVVRPPKQGEPFATEVVFNRLSSDWQNSLQVRKRGALACAKHVARGSSPCPPRYHTGVPVPPF